MKTPRLLDVAFSKNLNQLSAVVLTDDAERKINGKRHGCEDSTNLQGFLILPNI
jgi:hypothetical protein